MKGFLRYRSVKTLANSNSLGCKVLARIVVGNGLRLELTEKFLTCVVLHDQRNPIKTRRSELTVV
jgi:hypothetical protein